MPNAKVVAWLHNRVRKTRCTMYAYLKPPILKSDTSHNSTQAIKTHEQARSRVFNDMAVYYNRQRRHSTTECYRRYD